jgi:tetratricopeptide (TPR) repeat protein
VLDARRRIANETHALEDYVALGSLFADLRDFAAADRAYKQALRAYRDVSPFPVAGICFQLGVLWGELASEPDLSRAKQWYRQAIAFLPMYTKALVHLAEIYSSEDSLSEAETLLRRVIAVGDPEVDWRLADVLAAQGKIEDAEARMEAARSGFQFLLERHLLAFADHGAEFYAGSGSDYRRALQLARINADNRPTLRALEQAHNIATSANEVAAALQLLSEAIRRWGHTSAFTLSSLQRHRLKDGKGAVA